MSDLIKIRNKNIDKKFAIKMKSNDVAEIVIYEDIGKSDWFSDALSAKDFDATLKDLPANVNTIEVRINSYGGDVFDGITIYNRLKKHKAKKIVYIDGIAASIASVIAMAGDEIVMGEGAVLMIHSAWTIAMGNSRDFLNTADRLDEIDDQIVGIYQKKTGMDRNELKDMIHAETFIYADEAVEKGFADKKDEDMTASIAASANKMWIKGKVDFGAESRNHIKNKIDGFKNNLKEVLARN